VLAFIFTTCKSVCPLISQQMASLQNSLKSAGLFGKKASLISITVDPQRDTAQVLASYSKHFGVDKTGWRFLRESPERIKTVLDAYDEWTKLLPDGDMDHPARVYLIDPKGQIRDIYSLAFFNEKQAFIDIQALLK
jgi:protein SCO1